MTSGIYKIINIATNDFYIGSAVIFRKRKNSHFHMLRHNKHDNIHLQRAYNKYGEENFVFEILCNCPKEYTLKLEQWFLDNLKPHYNIMTLAKSRLGIKMSPESIEKMRQSKLGKPGPWFGKKRPEVKEWLYNNNPITEETKLKMSNSHKGNTYSLGYKQTDEHKQKSALGRTGLKRGLSLKTFKLSKGEEEIIIEGIYNVAEYLNCNKRSINNSLNTENKMLYKYKLEIING